MSAAKIRLVIQSSELNARRAARAITPLQVGASGRRALGTGKRGSELKRFGGSVMSRSRYRLWTEEDLERLRALVLSALQQFVPPSR